MSKMLRLYYFVDDRYGIENIEKRRLKVSFADRVNDLFELRPFDFGEGEKGRKLRLAWGHQIKEHAKTQGFISFSDNWNVPTMWGHYGNNHYGICLGFDVPANIVQKMDYETELLPMDDRVLTVDQYNKEMIEHAQKTKSAHWEYENEWRAWCTLNEFEKTLKSTKPDQLIFRNFDANLILREVIFGHRSTLTTEKIQKFLSPSDEVTITTARPSFREFSMVAQINESFKK